MRFLVSSLSSTEPDVGLVFTRLRTGVNAFMSCCWSLSIVCSLFSNCDRDFWDVKRMTPSSVILEASLSNTIIFSSAVNPAEWLISNKTSTLVSVLLTCCPPAPELRLVRNDISDKITDQSNYIHFIRWVIPEPNFRKWYRFLILWQGLGG